VLNFFARYTIRAKVIAAFGLILCCTIGLGVFAVSRVAMLIETAALIGTDVVASNALNGAELSGERLLSLGFALRSAQTDAERARLAQEIEQTARSTKEKWAKYAADGVDPGQEQRLATAVEGALARFDATMRKVVELDKAGSHEQAGALLTGDGQKAAEEFRQAISSSLAFQNQQGTDAVSEAADGGGFAKVMIIAVLCLMAIVCTTIGWLMVLSISKPIGMMTNAMQSLAQKDFAVSVPGVGRGDEIGGMANAM
jgi:methyl-accepting chemotaxis protein